MEKKHFRFGSLVLFFFGVFFLLNLKTDITGAVVGVSNISSSFSSILGVVFILVSIVILISGESLEERLKSKRTIIQIRGNKYCLINAMNGESYSLNDIKKFVQDEDLKRELRREYFSDLLILYANSTEKERPKYKMFINALSPNTSDKHLSKRLRQFENAYGALKDKLEYRNPKRIQQIKSSYFSDQIYVRVENEKETFWPEEESVDFLPFDEVKVNPSRGPSISVIPFDKLVKDGYLLAEGETLNPKWSPQKRQDYLREEYGIDIGTRQRHMILFQVENGTKIEPYHNYINIVVDKKVPLVKVKKKK